jgi:hypothetical protein
MKPLSNQQRLHLVNSEQLFQSYRIALGHADAYRFGMRWKKVRHREYLFRDHDRRGNGKMMGPRSPETEKLLASFTEGRKAAQERLGLISEKLQEQARLNKALRLNRIPRVVARILRELDRAGLEDSFTLIGTQALYAYEVAGGAHFLLELLASGDVDLLYDTRRRMTIVCTKLEGEGLLGLLQKADRSFERLSDQPYRAVNAGEFMVDLVIPPGGMRPSVPVTFGQADLIAVEVPSLQWLIHAPKLEAVGIDEEGWPTPMRVPDPRAFALHKAWLSKQVLREPLKKPRDWAQAQAVARLVQSEMPHLPFAEVLTALHADVRGMLEEVLGAAG